MWSTRGPRTSKAQGSGGPSNVKVLLRLIPDMLIRDLVLLRYRGAGQSLHNHFDIINVTSPFVFC